MREKVEFCANNCTWTNSSHQYNKGFCEKEFFKMLIFRKPEQASACLIHTFCVFLFNYYVIELKMLWLTQKKISLLFLPDI